MPDWTKSMQRTYEYYLVDPLSWCDKSRITCVKSSTIERDSSEATTGHATLEVTESLNECYIRIYMVVIQNGVTEKFPLATVLAQTPGNDFDGKIASMSIEAYMPLVELKETLPPYGFTIMKNANIMENACKNIQEHMRAPLIVTESNKTLVENFVSNTDDTWLTFNSDLIAKADFSFSTDEMGTVTFSPKRELEAMQPVVTFGDDEHSILQPSISTEYDLYGVPNVVEVIYSGDSQFFMSRIVNDDPTSITSTVNRGREILYRDTNPNITGTVSQAILDTYAKNLLKAKSTLEYKVTFKHAYYPVRVGDCVRLNYERAGLENVKVRITSQSIPCDAACQVEETGVFTKQLWGDL